MVADRRAELSGERGELVDRLLWVINGDDGISWLQPIELFLAATVGGSSDTKDIDPACRCRMRARLCDFAAGGVPEELLVMTLRDGIENLFAILADGCEGAETKELQDLINDPSTHAAIRSVLAGLLVGGYLNSQKAASFAEHQSKWSGLSAMALSDDDLHRWRSLHLARLDNRSTD